MQPDRVTPHICEGQQKQQAVQVVQQLPQTAREKRIDELALMKITALDRIGTALEKNNNQNIADALYFLAESMTEMAHAIKTQALALTQTQVGKRQEEEITAV